MKKEQYDNPFNSTTKKFVVKMTTDISVGVRWDPINQQNETINQDDYEFEYDGGNSSSRLFERSRIKALAGKKSR